MRTIVDIYLCILWIATAPLVMQKEDGQITEGWILHARYSQQTSFAYLPLFCVNSFHRLFTAIRCDLSKKLQELCKLCLWNCYQLLNMIFPLCFLFIQHIQSITVSPFLSPSSFVLVPTVLSGLNFPPNYFSYLTYAPPVPARQSEGPLFRRSTIPKVHYSEDFPFPLF